MPGFGLAPELADWLYAIVLYLVPPCVRSVYRPCSIRRLLPTVACLPDHGFRRRRRSYQDPFVPPRHGRSGTAQPYVAFRSGALVWTNPVSGKFAQPVECSCNHCAFQFSVLPSRAELGRPLLRCSSAGLSRDPPNNLPSRPIVRRYAASGKPARARTNQARSPSPRTHAKRVTFQLCSRVTF